MSSNEQIPRKIQLKLKKCVTSVQPLIDTNAQSVKLSSSLRPKTPPPPKIDLDEDADSNTNINSDKSFLKPISSEQQTIIDLVDKGHNICVDAVAGSGKTTTSLYIAINNPTKPILLLTYNAKLKLETRVKVGLLGLTNLEVHSYHSFCVKYFYRKSYTDSGIIAFLKLNDVKTCLKMYHYELIIVDEAQDMNPVYYEVVQHILKRLENKPQLIVMGDQKQSIYAFNNADSRFLALSDQIFSNGLQWEKCTLSTSYRLTDEMSQFINTCCNGALPINTVKKGSLVRYLICDTFGCVPYHEIKTYLRHGYKPSDIFILTPSVRSESSPVRQLANKLTNDGISIYVPTSDEEKLDEDILQGKIVFSTFHQVKGLERPVVMVFNFDNSYYKFYAKDIPPYEYRQIPNTIYVAITRATQRLILLHDKKSNYFDFLKRTFLSSNCNLDITCSFHPVNEKTSCTGKPKDVTVTDLVKYVPVDVLDQCMNYLTIEKQSERDEALNIPIKVKQDDLYEGVSEITGSAIPCYYEYVISNKFTVYDYLKENKMSEVQTYLTGKKCSLLNDKDDNDEESQLYDSLYEKLSAQDNEKNKCKSLLQLTTHWVCKKTGYDFKKKQIKKYDWLTNDVLEQALLRIDAKFPPETHSHLEFEKLLIAPYDSFVIYGFADIYNNLTHELWELKVVKEIDNTHFLQVAIYYWMIGLKEDVTIVYLFNIMDNAQYVIHLDPASAENIVKILINHRKLGQIKKSNHEFLDKCHKISDKINNSQ
jgi:hypothetical protein